MRLAFLPTISARNVAAASSYNWFRALRWHAQKADPQATFYVLVPEIAEGSGWQDTADWSGPNTHVLPVPMYRSQNEELALVTRDLWELFNERHGELYFDVFLTERPDTAPILKQLLSFYISGKSRKPLVVVRDQFTRDYEWFKVGEFTELNQACGWACAPTVFQSPHQKKRAIGIARKHLQGTMVRKIVENSVVFPLGIDCEDIDRTNMAERGQKYDRLTINYSHKLFLEQKFLQSLEIMDGVLAGGRDVQLQIVTGSSAGKMVMLKQARKYKYMTTYGSSNRSTFLKQMARAHVFVSNSIYEDFSATVAEQIYTGLLPVLLRADWSEYLTGADYPYLFSSKQEGQVMLRYVLDNYEAVAAEWVPKLQDKMRSEFDLASITPAMVEYFGGLRAASLETLVRKATPSLVEAIDLAWEALPDEFDLAMFYDALKQHSEHLNVLREAESNSTSKWMCVDLLLARHEVTDLGTKVPRYRKGGDGAVREE